MKSLDLQSVPYHALLILPLDPLMTSQILSLPGHLLLLNIPFRLETSVFAQFSVPSLPKLRLGSWPNPHALNLFFFGSLLRCHHLMSSSLAPLTIYILCPDLGTSCPFPCLLYFLPSLITSNISCVFLIILIYCLSPSTRRNL